MRTGSLAALLLAAVGATPFVPWGKSSADQRGDDPSVRGPAATPAPSRAPSGPRDERVSRALGTRPPVSHSPASSSTATRPPTPTPSPKPTPVLPGCVPRDLDYPNGEIPTSALCRLPGTSDLYLAPKAAIAFVELSRAYRARFGVGLCVTDAYRGRAAQSAAHARKPGLAAPPGRSNHGWGTAIDVCGGGESFDTPRHAWLARHAGAFGWVNPSWARRTGDKPEPWHWEFAGR